jgi:putative addiction module killer protein
MKEIRQTEYSKWFGMLRDQKAKARIDIRIRRLSLGNFGDVEPVGEAVSELRVDYGPGYRVYILRRGEAVVVLLWAATRPRRPVTFKLPRDWQRSCDGNRNDQMGSCGAPRQQRGCSGLYRRGI